MKKIFNFFKDFSYDILFRLVIIVFVFLVLFFTRGCSNNEEDYDSLKEDYNSLQEEYDSLKTDYNLLKSEYDELIDEYDSELEYWDELDGYLDDLKDKYPRIYDEIMN